MTTSYIVAIAGAFVMAALFMCALWLLGYSWERKHDRD